jgi:uncharacterized membrane protein
VRRETRERLANEAAVWRHSGLIDDALAAVLAERYDASGAAGLGLLRWLGLFGVFTVGAAILGWIGIALAETGPFMPALLLAGGGGAVGVVGARLARDPLQKHPVLGAALVTVGLMGLGGALALGGTALGLERLDTFAGWVMLLTAALSLASAYALRLRWPLLLGLLLLFHALGGWHAYGGHGSYFADIRDEGLMVAAALAAVGLGVWHEAELEEGPLPHHLGFGRLYLVFGLLYFNLSLWFLSLEGMSAGWVLAFTAGALAQIVIGAARKDSRFTGFGIVFLGIDLYTRYFEHFWDRLSAGSFFLLAGLAGMGLGYLFERRAGGRELPR